MHHDNLCENSNGPSLSGGLLSVPSRGRTLWMGLIAAGLTSACTGGEGNTAETSGAQVDQGTTDRDVLSTGDSGSADSGSGGSSMGTGGTNESAAGGTGAAATGSGGERTGGGSGGQSTESSSGGAGEMMGSGGFTGTCTASQPVDANASGSGPHEVVIETNSDAGINEGTIFRPADLGGAEKYPIFVWGEGACSRNGLSNRAAMAEIASYGYFVVADGTPNGNAEGRGMNRDMIQEMGAPLLAYIDWAIAENEKPCSVYYDSLDPNLISSNGFSCGGMMAQGTIFDERITTWGVTSSGMAGAKDSFYEAIHTPVLFVEGDPTEVAYDGAKEGYNRIKELGVPVLWFSSKSLGHGGDLGSPGGGDFTKLNLAWLNWWLKGDEGPTGKGLLVGAGCPYCTDSGWEYLSANIP